MGNDGAMQPASSDHLPPHTEDSNGILLDVDGWDDVGDVEVDGEVRDAMARGQRVRALIADQDVELALLMRRLLKSKGFSADTSQRGLEVLARVRANPPELLIVDTMLPEWT